MKNTIEQILLELIRVVEPLAAAIDEEPRPNGLLRLASEAGLELDAIFVETDSILPIANSFLDAFGQVRHVLENSGIPDLSEIPQVVNGVKRFLDALHELDTLPARSGVDPILTPVGQHLLNYLLIQYLRNFRPGVYGFLKLTGVIQEKDHSQAQLPEVRFERLVQSLSDPSSIAREIHGWGTTELKQYEVLIALKQLLLALNVPAFFNYPDPADATAVGTDPDRENPDSQLKIPLITYEKNSVIGEAGLAVIPLPSVRTDPAGFAFTPFGVGSVTDKFPLNNNWTLLVDASAGAPPAYGVVLRPSGVMIFGLEGTAPPPKLEVHIGVTRSEAIGSKTLLLGSAEDFSFSVDTIGLLTDFDFNLNGSEFGIRFPIQGARISLKPPEGDGFLASILPSKGINADFDITVGWSSFTGLSFDGSAQLDVSLASHHSFGPLRIDNINFVVGLFEEREIKLTPSLSATFAMGPFLVSIERIGLTAVMKFPADRKGNFGPLNFEMGFQPPTGLGLLIDAGPVVGGGFLSFDHPNGRYSGLLQLEMFGIGVTAIGLLTTKDVTGQPLPPPGFSLLMIISVEFPAIQLGFGFTLNGVGGLIGIHRTLLTQALQDGVREGSVDHIMFPEDPLQNMPQIIGDLETVFPSQVNRFVFGPMALIGWGTPTLVRIELGIVLEVPDPVRLVLLGQMDVQLPSEDAPIIELHLDVVGILDFDKKLFSIDASLHDSRVAAFSVYGDMAFRLGWGEQPVFALSVGGLNPHFQPPPNFPPLRRATVSLGLGENPRISIQGYLAVTSNSLQFGAKAELYAAAAGFNVYGWLWFDALFIFSPFYFRFDFSLGFALRKGKKRIFGISISGTLEGPNPFHIRGEGCISILFFDLCIGIDVTFGRRQDQVALPTKDPWIPLKEAIENERHWSAVLPPATHIAVSLKSHPVPEKQVLVHPMGTITLRQQVVPFNHSLEKFGEFGLSEGPVSFELTRVVVGTQEITRANYDEVKDIFVPGHFELLSDADKLSRDSFERMVAGIALGSRRVKFGASRQRILNYETSIVDSPWDSRSVQETRHTQQDRTFQVAGSRRGAKAFSGLRRTGPGKFTGEVKRPKAFTLKEELFCIAKTEDLKRDLFFGEELTQGQARQKLKTHLNKNPQDRDRFQIVPEPELQDA